MKILMLEYAILISERLHYDTEFLSRVEYFILKGFSVRIIFSYGPNEHNPILRSVEEFKEFIRQCPDTLPSKHPSKVLLTGEMKPMKRSPGKSGGGAESQSSSRPSSEVRN